MDYSTNLGLSSKDVVYTSRGRWISALALSALRRRSALILNSGEVVVDAKFLADRLLTLPIIALIRARKGQVIQTGIGIRNPSRRGPVVLRWFARAFTLMTWRDSQSLATAQAGELAPDWALMEGSDLETLSARFRLGDSEPRLVAVSIRGDHAPPTEAWLTQFRQALRSLNAEAVVVSQVRRDNDRAAWLARALECELVDWPDDISHHRQESRVRAVYRRCAWAASDRLHVLIAAYTEGCVPLNSVPDSGGKVARTLAAFGTSTRNAEAAEQQLDDDRATLISRLAEARERLEEITAEIRSGTPAA
ncbi:hypothetical protein GCM10009816_13570 [Microbacterium aquimaris]